MKNETTKKHGESVGDVGKIAECLGDVRKYIPFIHAFGGCDTTSAKFGLGKLSIMTLIGKSDAARQAAVFLKNDSTPEDIKEGDLQLFVMLYAGKVSDNLVSLRYAKYMKMSSTTELKPEKLPPTEKAAYFHCLRVFHQAGVEHFTGK